MITIKIKSKKVVLILILIIILIMIFLIGFSQSFKHPIKPPELKITSDKVSFLAVKNEYNWFENTGSTNLGTYSIEKAKSIKGYKIGKGQIIRLELTSNKGLKEFNVKKVEGTSIYDYNITDITTETSFIAPEQPGEYIYQVDAFWDDTHSIQYVFKVFVSNLNN
ncbi:hypothetical protein [Clostridium sp. C8-1-8]|uniref:hypothetical protein n=1 Tax=Clostridium sp. C8-1-8 TaxID=2698831 RepID=UPI00136A3745|nr:hypothetical protein [Clostridium sp. C8-1-8]